MKERFVELLKETGREGVEELIKHLEETGFFDAPASAYSYLAENGGLLKHSLNVCELSLKLAEQLNYENRSSVILVGLLSNVSKSKYFEKEYFKENILKSGKRSESKPFEKNKELLGVPSQVATIQIINKFIELTEEETHAIIFKNGMYDGLGRNLNGNETKLQMILHFADLWDSRVGDEQ